LQFTLFINFGIWDRKILEEVEFNYLLDSCLWSSNKDTRHGHQTRYRYQDTPNPRSVRT
jgi:hypothetical protein